MKNWLLILIVSTITAIAAIAAETTTRPEISLPRRVSRVPSIRARIPRPPHASSSRRPISTASTSLPTIFEEVAGRNIFVRGNQHPPAPRCQRPEFRQLQPRPNAQSIDPDGRFADEQRQGRLSRRSKRQPGHRRKNRRQSLHRKGRQHDSRFARLSGRLRKNDPRQRRLQSRRRRRLGSLRIVVLLPAGIHTAVANRTARPGRNNGRLPPPP